MGDPRSVPEIRAAVELFEQWEKAPGDPGAADLFAQALEQLQDCVEPEHATFIRNVRLANTRRLLNQLSRVRVSDLANWAGYAAILQSSAEARSVIDEQPELKKVLDAFVEAHK